MKFIFLLLLTPIFGWGSSFDSILKIAEKEIGPEFKPQLEKLKEHADLLQKKTPFGKDESPEAFFKGYVERKNLSTTDIQGIKDFFKIQDRKTSRIFIVDEYEIQGFTWEDMGLKNPDNFFRPIADAWQKELQSKADDVEVCVADCLKFYTVWMSQSSEELKGYPGDLSFSHISFVLQRPAFNSQVKEVTFSWNGRVHTSSLATKDTSKTLEISQEQARWLAHDQKKVNSLLAQRIYQSGLLPLERSFESLNTSTNDRHSFILELKGLKTIDEGLGFIRFLGKKDPGLRLKGEIGAIGPGSLTMKCSYEGAEKRFTDLLSSIKELKLSRSYKIQSNLAEGVHTVKFSPN